MVFEVRQKRPLLAGQARQAWGFFYQGPLGYDSETAVKNFLPSPLKLVFFYHTKHKKYKKGESDGKNTRKCCYPKYNRREF